MSVSQLFDNQKAFFDTHQTLSVQFRKDQLRALRKLLTDHHESLLDALEADFNKPRYEAYITEILPLLHEIDHHLKHIKRWAAPQRAKGSLLIFPSRNRILYRPFGTVLIIAAWNYPIHLLLMPLIGAISAGNTAILKPSELAPETARTLRQIFDSQFDPDYLRVVEGGAETGKKLLENPFDLIFFTGGRETGKKILRAAAEYLTPTVLELGGKSPAIIHHDADLELAAKRIWWGKCINSGQTCVAPDYLMIHKNAVDRFIGHLKRVHQEFFTSKNGTEHPDTCIVHQEQYERLVRFLDQGEVLLGGSVDPDRRYIEPTLLRSDPSSPVMKEEIFGPILPFIVYEEMEELARQIERNPDPLAFYLFTKDRQLQNTLIEEIPFGGGCINDTIMHLGNPHLPFGGVRRSGFGSYHGEHSFKTFSYQKSITYKPAWPDPDFRYPPYTSKMFNLIKKYFHR